MFLRRHQRKKNGETYDYWTLVESVRTSRGARHGRGIADAGGPGDPFADGQPTGKTPGDSAPKVGSAAAEQAQKDSKCSADSCRKKSEKPGKWRNPPSELREMG